MSTNFITTEELKQITAISNSVDINLLVPFIQVSEEMGVYPILGTALVTELQTQLDNVSISGVNETLLNEYIIPYDAWNTFMEASVFLVFRTNNKGVTKNFSDTSQAIDRFELSIYRQSIADKVSFYRNRLIDYLNDNKDLYPLYRPECGTILKGNSTGFWLG